MPDILIPAPHTANDARRVAGWFLDAGPAVMSGEFCITVSDMLRELADRLEAEERQAFFAADRPTEADGVR